MKRRRKGASIAETAASMVLFIPLIVTILFVVLEASKAYLIKEGLSQGAREAARNLAVIYGQNPSIQFNRTSQDAMVFSSIHINDVIVSSAQFADPTWDPTGANGPPSVTVTVNYTSGQNGLPPFPDPDPLHLGSTFHLSATSTYRLE